MRTLFNSHLVESKAFVHDIKKRPHHPFNLTSTVEHLYSPFP